MGRFSESADVRPTVDETFAYITDQGRLAEWNAHVQWAEVIGGGSVEVGSKLRQHRKRNNRAFDLIFEVTSHDPPRRHVVEGSVIGLDTTMSFTVEPSGPGSQVTMMANVTGRGLRRLLAPVVTNEMRKSTGTGPSGAPTAPRRAVSSGALAPTGGSDIHASREYRSK